MTSCKSVTSSVSSLWKEYKNIVSLLGCGSVGVLVSPAAAIACLKTTNKVQEAIEKAVKRYEDVVGKTSPKTLGPRQLRPNTWEEGSIPGTFGRLFVTAMPMHEDTVSITIKELDGKGKVGIAICSVDENGKHEKLADYTLNEDKSEKKDKSQQIKKTLTKVKGKWILVHIDGKSVANTFKYKLLLDV